MELNLNLTNIEDIEYIKSINYDKDILNTALTIGLKSIQMSQTTMTGNSYFEPIKDIFIEQNNENKRSIESINDMLKDLLQIKGNSSRKGKLGESLAFNTLSKKYPSWKIENTSNQAHESDLFAHSEEYGKILYEIKTYSTNVGTSEIEKFKSDIITTNSKNGIFVSQTSGIVNKKLIDYEIYNGHILVYVSCAGLNGLGIEVATEFLMSLIDTNINNKILNNNDQLLNRINNSMFDLHECINNFSRIKSQISDTKTIINKQLDLLYRHTYEYEIKGTTIINTILNDIKINSTNAESLIQDGNTIDAYINTLDESTKLHINTIREICNNNDIQFNLQKDIFFIIRNEKLICKIMTDDNSVELYFEILNNRITFNMEYEMIKDDKIHIKIYNNVYDDIKWKIINDRLKY